jgi:hypothetical protein
VWGSAAVILDSATCGQICKSFSGDRLISRGIFKILLAVRSEAEMRDFRLPLTGNKGLKNEFSRR